jgi:ribonucleoside-diphosphate reductase alpha chain
MEEFKTKDKKTWVKNIDYPEWMDIPGLTTLDNGYLLEDESPKDAMYRIARKAGEILKMPQMVEPLFESLWKGYICPSTPVWCNFGAPRALPISCFAIEIEDSLSGIYDSVAEIAMMSKMGGGTAAYAGNLRARGSKITTNGGESNGPKSFAAPFDTTINIVTQGKSRRGSMAWYLPFKHPDIMEHLQIKDVGDPIQNLFPGVCIDEDDYEAIYSGEEKALEIWAKILESKNKTGLPYIFNTRNANNHESVPLWYGRETDNKIKTSQLCTEIFLPTNLEESFVCCLLSMNFAKYDEWKNTKAVRGAIYLLEAIMQEFIDKTEGIKEMSRARKFAERHRALGLGILGWHTYLQSKNQPFIGYFADYTIKTGFKQIYEQADRASEKLAEIFGNCPIVDEFNLKNNHQIKRRNSTLLAIAPTVSNATIQNVSPGKDPIPSNYYLQKAAKGNFTIKNKELEKLLTNKYNKNTEEVWKSIRENSGSVQHLDFMDKEDKELYLTFSEINQFALVKQTALMQNYIDQGISLNVNIPPDTDPKTVSSLYLMGYELGIKSFYYQRSENILRKGLSTMDSEVCVTCSG